MATQYRDTRAGSALVDALDELVTEGRLPGDLAVKVLEEVRLKRGERERKGDPFVGARSSLRPPPLPLTTPPPSFFLSLSLSHSSTPSSSTP